MTEPIDAERLLAETAWLRRLARSLVRGTDLADDVVQETLLRACRSPAVGVRHARAWLAVVAASVARRFARTRARQERCRTQLPPRAPEPAVVDAIARTEALQRVMAALLALPEPYRAVLLLRFQGELGYAAIAARLGVPLETVRTQIKRGLQRLRERLDERHGAAWAGPFAAWVGARGAAAGLVVVGAAAVGAALLLVPTAPLGPPALRAAPAAVAEATTRAASASADVPFTPPAREAAEPLLVAASTSTAAEPPPPAAASDGLWWVVGRVVDARGAAPIAGASALVENRYVRIEPRDDAPRGAAPRPDDERSVTGADGRFRVAGGVVGDSQLTVRAPGATATAVLLGSPAGGPRGGAAIDNEIDVGDVPLHPARILSGSVASDAGVPAPGASVCTLTLLGARVWCDHVATTDDAGNFVAAVPFELAGATCFVVAMHGLSHGAVPLAAPGWHDVRLAPLAELAVEVVDEHGVAIAGANVQALPLYLPTDDGVPRIVGGDRLPRRHSAGVTDARGRVQLRALPVASVDGACDLRVAAAGHRGEHRRQALVAGRNDVRVVLPHGERARLRGVVVDAATGAAIAGALVDGSLYTATDGTFTLPDVDLRRGAIALPAFAVGYEELRHVEPVGGRAGDIDLRLELTRSPPRSDARAAVGGSRGGTTMRLPLGNGGIQLPDVIGTTPSRSPAR